MTCTSLPVPTPILTLASPGQCCAGKCGGWKRVAKGRSGGGGVSEWVESETRGQIRPSGWVGSVAAANACSWAGQIYTSFSNVLQLNSWHRSE